jgi:conjugal transfer mating pair stabilization protein TraN
MTRRLAIILAAILLSALAGPIAAEQRCTANSDGSGETAACSLTEGGDWFCPLGSRLCQQNRDGEFLCPLGPQYLCARNAEGAAMRCSPNSCFDADTPPSNPGDPPPTGPGPGDPPPTDPPPTDPPPTDPSPGDPPPVVVDEPLVDDPGAPADGGIDADGHCLGTIEIFAGRALRCRPPGARTSLQNCCKDKGEIIRDGMGSQLSSLSTKIAVARQVFTGMKAAYAAYQAGATAGAAASAGLNAMVVGIDPTSIAISLAVNYMVEVLLQGCDQQDMETGMLRGSGMCHEVGTYCASSILGVCIQEAKSHCCFNTRLGRILQEQGRPQLKSFDGIGWGPVKHPLCRGFTPEEFQAIDFSKIDLREYYSEIAARGQSLIQTDMKEQVDAYLHDVAR